MKRFFAILLIIALLPLPAVSAHEVHEPAVIPAEAFDAVAADVWQDIEAIEEARVDAKRGRLASAVDYAALAEEVAAAVEASETYLEGSLRRNGAFLTWRTTEGVACGYSPRLRALARQSAIDGADPEAVSAVETTSYAVRGGFPSSAEVAVFQPYFGIDENFKTTYASEGERIAQALGGTSTTYIGEAATIDAIADALETCAVVIFDSHGDTDYQYLSKRDDHVSRANTCYICLQSGEGLTTEDMADVTGVYGTYRHAFFAGTVGKMQIYCVDGTAIANHMDANAPNSILWSAICYCMATDGLHAPLRERGVEIAYGYSQSVTFSYDYKCEKAFWDQMLGGKTAAQALSAMKAAAGEWDGRKKAYATIESARAGYRAFPILVSSEDAYPGHGCVDDLQTVCSGWRLKEGEPPCAHGNTASEHEDAGCTTDGFDRTVCVDCGEVLSESILPALGHDAVTDAAVAPTCTQTGLTEGEHCTRCDYEIAQETVPALGHDFTVTVVEPTCTEIGYTLLTCAREGCGEQEKNDLTDKLGHVFEDGVCLRCGEQDPGYLPPEPTRFDDVSAGAWYYDAVNFAVYKGLMNGVGSGSFDPDGSMTRAMLVTVLWRYEGSTIEGANTFIDVPDGQWYTDAVAWAAENGIVTGVGGGRFDPNGRITREQMAAILYRYASGKGFDTSVRGSLSAFSDRTKVSAWADEPICWAVGAGIVGGSDGLLAPQGSATRAQVSTILMRFIKSIT